MQARYHTSATKIQFGFISVTHIDGGVFDHLVAYSLACTFENEVVSAKKYGSLCFGSLNEVINDDDLICLDEGKNQVMRCSTRRARWNQSSNGSSKASEKIQ